jgi:hypothetical protein
MAPIVLLGAGLTAFHFGIIGVALGIALILVAVAWKVYATKWASKILNRRLKKETDHTSSS